MSKVALSIIAMFALTQLLGIYVGALLVENSKTVPEFGDFNVSPVSDMNSPLNAILFFAYVIGGAVFLVLVLKFYKGVLLFKGIEFMVIFTASFIVFFVLLYHIVFSVLLYQHTALSLLYVTLASILLSLLLSAGKFIFAKLKNSAAVISSAGVGALFGFSIGFYPALLFVLLLALYDYWAVFKTGHMVKFARELGDRKLSFSISARETENVKEKVQVKKGVYEEREKEVERSSMELGTGDLAIPAMLAVSIYPTGGIFSSLAIAFGSLIGLAFTLHIVSKNRVFLPAIPPICLGGAACLLLLRLILILL
ncbi:hypothetical protein COV61_01865 [Candidatus Micrarchaeota archaeon CG11_big_fil_rev_8_21_14_0_20_47_5]|nr:MAG: hypothetical protein AUJ17_00630 [Candidatus Micrarchaeota archaeon CG1_02_47_40]PIN83862.1 MAG: hypothetical protein COV61_01865 [Candidatus Micrarchaeota archaeon CG11_big_fil_rev_8_21_14_0_20_47_5]